MDRLNAIALGQEGFRDIKDTNAHTVGESDYADIAHFVGLVVLEDAVFNAATSRMKAGVVKTSVTYPAGAYIAGPFSVVQLDSGAVELIGEEDQ